MEPKRVARITAPVLAVVAVLVITLTLESGPSSAPPDRSLEAGIPSRLEDPAGAVRIARRFAVSSTRFQFGQLTATEIVGASPGLIRELARYVVPRAPTRLHARIELVSLTVSPTSSGGARAAGRMKASGVPAWPIGFEMTRANGHWQVTQTLDVH